MNFNDLIEAYGIPDRKFDKRIKYLYDQINHVAERLEEAGYEVINDLSISNLRDIADQIATGVDDPETGSAIHTIYVKKGEKVIEVGIWMWEKDVVTMTVNVKGVDSKEGRLSDEIDFSYNQDQDFPNVLSDSVLDMVLRVDQSTTTDYDDEI
jgi:hypothetical protein